MFSVFKTKIFTQLFLSCVLFFIIPFMLLSVITVSISSNSYRSDIISLKMEYSKNLKNNIDSQLAQINLTAERLSDSANIWNFSVKDKNLDYTQYIISAKNVSDTIKSLSKYHESIHYTSLYFPSQDSVISATALRSLEEYYNLYFKELLSFDKFKEIISSPKERIFSATNESGENTVILMRPLYGTSHGYSVVLLSTINIQHMIDTHNILNAHDTLNSKQSESYTVITDDENNILFKSEAIPQLIDISVLEPQSSDKVVKISKKYFATCQKSDIYPLDFICIFSYNNMSENFRLMRNILFLIIFLAIIIFLYVSYRFSLKTFSPFKALISVGTENKTLPYKVENYSQIKTLVLDIVNSNNNLTGVIENQRLSIANNMFKMLLQNSMDLDDDSFNLMFEDYAKKFPHGNFQVAVIRTDISNKDTLTMLQLSLLTALRNEAETKGILHFVIPSMSKDTIILFNHWQNKNAVIDLMESCTQPLPLKDLQFTIGIGRIIHSLNYFSKSYEDAMCALHCRRDNPLANVFHYDGSENNNLKSLYFTNEHKKRLQKALIDGDVHDVNLIFDEINATLFEENILTMRTLTYVCFSLSNLLVEVIDNLEIHNETTDAYINECQQAFSPHNFSENFKTIRHNFENTCNYIAKARIKSNTTLKETMLSYIEENYNNPDLSLHQVAEDIHVSYNYLCRFFKEHTGMAFLDYLHNLRIEKSKELLRNTNKSVNEIADELGYLSANSYIRKFRQKLNITPGEYRKNFLK